MTDIQQDREKVAGNVADMAHATSDYLRQDHPFQAAEILKSYALTIKNAGKNNEPLTAKAVGEELTKQGLGSVLSKDMHGNPTKLAIIGDESGHGKPQAVTLDLVRGTVDGMSGDKIDKSWTAEKHADAIREDVVGYKKGYGKGASVLRSNARDGGDLLEEGKAMRKDGTASEVAKMLGSDAQFHRGKNGDLESITLGSGVGKPIQVDIAGGKVDGMDKAALFTQDVEQRYADTILRKAEQGARSYTNGEVNLLAAMQTMSSNVSAKDFAKAVLEDLHKDHADVRYRGSLPMGLHLPHDK